MKPRTSSRNRPLAFKGVALALVCSLGVSAAPAQVFADEAQTRVKTYEEAIARGDAAWDAQEFAAARAAYEQAYLIHPEPTLLFNIASTYRRENNPEKALDYYENYLRAAPPDDQFRSQATETAARLRSELGAKPKVADKPRQRVQQPIIETRPRDDQGDSLNNMQWLGIGTGTVGLMSLTYAAFQGNKAVSAQNSLEKVQPGQQWTPALQDQYDKGKSSEQRAIIFGILGGAAVITGGTLFYLGHRRGVEERGLAVVPVADGDLAGAMVFGTF